MKTIKEIAIEFANESYSGYDEQNINELKQEYINDIIEYDFYIDGSDNKSWEAGYIRGYEVALKELALYYEDCIQYEAQFRAKQVFEKIQYLLTN